MTLSLAPGRRVPSKRRPDYAGLYDCQGKADAITEAAETAPSNP